ncbi:MAG: Rne/Rng family ribonuclease [Clostridia bacterium]|nr:Rne/Rng family ribonuclease [Clostridia bacterium]
MIEIIIQTNKNGKQIALIENGKLIEYYEEDKEFKRREGNIYIGIVKDVIAGMQSAFVDIGTEKNSFIHLKDILPKVDETKEKIKEDIEIKKEVKPNQKLLVQVKKDSNEKKGARVSTHINLPSKYIALLPNTDIITISQKIEDEKEQKRLIKIVKDNLSEGNGAIIRTSAQNKEKEIIEDIKKVEKKWNNILQTSISSELNEPKLLYRSENIVEKMLIDFTEDNNNLQIIVNDVKTLKELEDFKNENKEYSNLKIEIKEQENILDIYELEKQIEKIQNRKIWLKCGGFITIDKTEALTAIDVNTGKYTGNQNLEQTVYRVNQEATIEIVKQLKLRDIGGIIIIDYIDMKNKDNKDKIERLLKDELKKDRSKTQVEGFTKLDLMELTRKHICSHKD